MFVRFDNKFINLTAIEAFSFETQGGKPCLCVDFTDDRSMAAPIRSEIGEKLLEALMPGRTVDDVEAEFFGQQ